MGKRSNFDKIPKDAYMTTDQRATAPLLQFLGREVDYYEPCYGNGDLAKLLSPHRCVGFSDEEKDARTYQYVTDARCFITNPPWSRKLLHPIIDNLRNQLPTWLLFDAAWMFTAQSALYMKYCKVVIPVGRLRWIPGTAMDGKDDCAWYLFGKEESQCVFIPRKEKTAPAGENG